MKTDFYDTIEEASEAALSLGITTQKEYKKRYKEDLLLQSAPSVIYANKGWTSWSAFFGRVKKEFYKTYEEAKYAVQSLEIVSRREYVERYKEDLLLPGNPDRAYKNEGWIGYAAFFGKNKKDFYDTYEEAQSASQSLEILTNIEYKERYKEDPRLPSNPSKIYRNQGWVCWEDYLGKDKKDFYDTYEEAKSATQGLGITTQKEYRERYREDPSLSAIPESTYKDKGWEGFDVFFGRETIDLYDTYEEAKNAVESLEILTNSEYRERYKEDPCLPSNPNMTYKNKGWLSWGAYLATKTIGYKDAVKVLGTLDPLIRIPHEYNALNRGLFKLPYNYTEVYKTDYYDWKSFVGILYDDVLDAIELLKAKGKHVQNTEDYASLREWYLSLPENPVEYYGFDSFEEFIQFDREQLWDEKEVKEYSQCHKISSVEQYDIAARKEPRLATNRQNIPNFSKIGRILYQPSRFDVFLDDKFQLWISVADEWISKKTAISKKVSVMRSFFSFVQDSLPESPQEYCLSECDRPDINAWLECQADSLKNISTLNILVHFFDHVVETQCSIRCEDTGELITLEGYRNPISTKDTTVDLSGSDKLSESSKPSLPFRYIERARNFLVGQDKLDKTTNIGELSNRIQSKTSFFHNYSDWFKVERAVIDENDPDCVWKEEKGEFFMWSPVRILAIYTQLFMPFRGSQICWLDSGEADAQLLVQENNQFVWQDNPYHSSFRVPKKRHQGFLKPCDSSDVHAHVNTNKTAKNAATGYDIPWVDERLIPWVVRLRDWQTKYNPLDKPTHWKLVRKDTNINVTNKYGHKGHSFFLFRDPTDDGKRPLTQIKLASGFKGLLYLIQDDELPLAYPKKGKDDGALSNFAAHFTLHSMRVSLITAFIRDAKIAPEIVQKLVGHSSIVMTIYYTKVSAQEIRDALQNSESLIIKNQAARVDQMIRQRKMEQVKSEMIGADGELVSAKWDIPAAAFSVMDFGICPNGRTRCSDGGDPIRSDSIHHAPVPSGYLGSSNCLQCRHFSTGPAFLGGLQMLCNEITLECKASSVSIQELKESVDVLEDEQYQAKRNNQPFTQSHNLSLSESHYEQEVLRFDNLSCDLIRTIRLSLSSMNLLNCKIKGESVGDGHSLITTQSGDDIQVQFPEVSDFLHVDMICQSASIYQSSRPKNANLKRTQLVDLFARKNGLNPCLFELSERQQLEIGNEMTKLLRSRLGSWDAVGQLMDKDSTITLNDLGVEAVTDDLKLLFDGQSLGCERLDKPEPNLKLVVNDE